MALKASDLIKKGKGKEKGGKSSSLIDWIGHRRKGVDAKTKKGGKHFDIDKEDRGDD